MARPADVQRSTALTVVARSRLFTDLLWQCWQCWPLLHDGMLLHLQYSFLQQQGRPSASGYCQVQHSLWQHIPHFFFFFGLVSMRLRTHMFLANYIMFLAFVG